ncbi:MAG: hypothetical protein NZZ41_02975 [Candidatus Dojkabacteria bacterium]|nr:hypothetical protein [Candidatus Dojkabacteria bacterium]
MLTPSERCEVTKLNKYISKNFTKLFELEYYTWYNKIKTKKAFRIGFCSDNHIINNVYAVYCGIYFYCKRDIVDLRTVTKVYAKKECDGIVVFLMHELRYDYYDNNILKTKAMNGYSHEFKFFNGKSDFDEIKNEVVNKINNIRELNNYKNIVHTK